MSGIHNVEPDLREKNKTFSIGRIVSVNIIEGEMYYLKKLLNHINGAISYEDLKNVNGIHASTFRKAALLHGLLNGDTDCEMFCKKLLNIKCHQHCVNCLLQF